MADDRNAEQEAMEDRRRRLAQAEAEGDADEAIRIAQENIGRPPAHEVSLEHAERVYGHDPVNADPEVLAEGAEVAARSTPGAEVGAAVQLGTAADEEPKAAQQEQEQEQAPQGGGRKQRGGTTEPGDQSDDQEGGS